MHSFNEGLHIPRKSPFHIELTPAESSELNRRATKYTLPYFEVVRAKMILMAGAKIEAEEALAWGLIDRIVGPDDLLSAARGLAADVLAAKPGHAGAIKRLIG